MRYPIKLVVKKGKARKDGTSIVFVQYCYSEQLKPLLNTGVAIPAKYWNRKTGRISTDLPEQYGDVTTLETSLTNNLRKAEDMIDYVLKEKKGCLVDFLKANFHLSDKWQLPQMKETKQNLDVYYHIDQYIKEKESTVKKCTITVINAMKCHLKSFENYRHEAITFDSFDVDFYETFVKYLTYEIPHMRKKTLVKGLMINSIGKTIKHLKSFLRNRIAKKIIPFIDLTAYKGMEEDVDTVYLNWQEIAPIYNLDLSEKPNLIKYRDLFVVGCLTGFRFSDYTDIKPEEIRNGMLYVTQTKTVAPVIVPLRKEAREILDKYNMEMPQVSNPNFNEYIKEVCRLAGITEKVKITHKRGNKMIEETREKCDWVTSHACRRSFCTNEYLDGTPIHLIMAISGHKTEKAFRRYIKADQLQKALLIQEIWKNRPSQLSMMPSSLQQCG